MATTKDPEVVFGNPDSSVEEFCVAHIYGFKGIKEKMDEIKTKFSLTDSTEWRSVVVEAGRRKREQMNGQGKGGQGKGGQGKGGQGNGGQGAGGKGKFAKKDRSKKGKSNNFGKEELSGQNIPKEKKEDGNGSTANDKKNKANGNDKKIAKNNGDEKGEESRNETTNGNAKANAKTNGKNNKNKKNQKNKKNDLKLDESHISAPIKEPETQPKATTVDSFFITESGSNYMSTAVVDRVQADGPDDGLARKERRAKQFGNTITPKAKKFNNFGDGKPNGRGKPAEADGPDHPSWSAKRKQKVIPDFQGKKTKFGATDSKATKPAASTGDVHPSWAAKQKQKPTITEFKGLKTTFD